MDENRKYFHSDTCYKRYLYGKRYAEKINELLDKGYMVFTEYGEVITGRFIIEEGEIGLKGDNCIYGYIGSQYDDDGKIWLAGDPKFSKKGISQTFCKFKYVHPKDIKKLGRLI